MKTSKRIRDRKTFVSILIIGLLFLLFSLLFSLFFALLTGDVVRGLGVYSVCMYGIPSVLLLVGAVGTIITYVKPFIECMEIGIDAHGKRYLVANNANWFFENLSYDQIKRINDRIVELETWKERKISSFKSEKKRIRFIRKYNKHISHAFYCYIYRSGTRYRQCNYVKTPYIGASEYWGQYYSIESIKKNLIV